MTIAAVRRRSVRSMVPVALMILTACSSGSSDGDATTAFVAAVVAEDGVVPVVSDRVAELVDVDSVEVRRTPDGSVGTWSLLAHDGTTDPLVLVEARPDQPARLDDPRTLENGRAISGVVQDREIAVQFAGDDGQLVELRSHRVDVVEAIPLMEQLTVSGDAISSLPAGWTEAGSVTFPTWANGQSTRYDLADGGVVSITIERAQPGREALARFGPTVPVDDLGTPGWAVRYESPAVDGYLFAWFDNTVVDLTGDLDDDQFREVIASLRPLRPGESRILPPT